MPSLTVSLTVSCSLLNKCCLYVIFVVYIGAAPLVDISQKPLSPVPFHTLIPEVDTIVTSNDGLLHHQYLDTLHLVVNEEFRFLLVRSAALLFIIRM
jgi:hypothetical protein